MPSSTHPACAAVSRVGRTTGWCPGLNEDLVEAIAPGYAPTATPGRRSSKKHGGPGTMSRSCTSSTSVGDCNLTVQGMDGGLCHNGGQHDQVPAVEGDATRELLAL